MLSLSLFFLTNSLFKASLKSSPSPPLLPFSELIKHKMSVKFQSSIQQALRLRGAFYFRIYLSPLKVALRGRATEMEYWEPGGHPEIKDVPKVAAFLKDFFGL